MTTEEAAPTYFTGDWNSICTTTAAPTVEEVLATVSDFQQKRAALDREFAAALRRCIEINHWPLERWAVELRLTQAELAEVLAGQRPPSGWLWEQMRRLVVEQQQKQKEQP